MQNELTDMVREVVWEAEDGMFEEFEISERVGNSFTLRHKETKVVWKVSVEEVE